MSDPRDGAHALLQRWARLRRRKALVDSIVDFDSASGFVVEEGDARRFVAFESAGLTRVGAAEMIRRLWSNTLEDQLQALERLLINDQGATAADFKRALAIYGVLHGGGEEA